MTMSCGGAIWALWVWLIGRGRDKGTEGVMGDKGRDEPGVLGYIGGGQGKRPAVWSDPTFALSTHRARLGSLPSLRCGARRPRTRKAFIFLSTAYTQPGYCTYTPAAARAMGPRCGGVESRKWRMGWRPFWAAWR